MTRWLWTAADGSVIDLSAWSSGTYVVDDGTQGELAPEYEFATQSFAGIDGEQLQQVNAVARTTTLGVDLVGDGSSTSVRDRVRALAHAMRPRRGIGALRAVDEDGTERRLPCYYRKGLESGTYRAQRYRCALEFWAPSPWWRGAPFVRGFELAPASAFFPIPPIRLSATTISGSATLDLSDTDAPTYPTWTVTGPGSQLTLRNNTTGQSLVLTPAGGIGDGQLVVIDTRPGYQSVRLATPGAITGTSEQRRNLVPNPAPASATSYSANYGTGGAGTLSYAATGGPTGGGYVRATWTTASTAAGSGQVRHDGRAAQPLPIPVTPGQVLSGACWARSSIAQRLVAQVTYFDAAGTQTGIAPTGHAGTPQVLAPNTWTRLTVEGVTVPAGAAYALIGPQAVTGTGAVVWPVAATLDQAQTQIELASTVGDYFDGATADTGSRVDSVVHDWVGAADASASTQSIVTAADPPVLGTSLFRYLSSDPAMWPLLDDVNDVSVLLTNAGARSRVDVVADRLYSGAR